MNLKKFKLHVDSEISEGLFSATVQVDPRDWWGFSTQFHHVMWWAVALPRESKKTLCFTVWLPRDHILKLAALLGHPFDIKITEQMQSAMEAGGKEREKERKKNQPYESYKSAINCIEHNGPYCMRAESEWRRKIAPCVENDSH